MICACVCVSVCVCVWFLDKIAIPPVSIMYCLDIFVYYMYSIILYSDIFLIRVESLGCPCS